VLWERFVGQPVKVKLVLTASRVPKAEPEKAMEVHAVEVAPAEDPAPVPVEDPPEDDRTKAAAEAEVGDGAEATGQKSSAEIARIFKERFDGEIIEKKEGKD